MFSGPSELHFTGCLARIKSSLKKQRTWEDGTLEFIELMIYRQEEKKTKHIVKWHF